MSRIRVPLEALAEEERELSSEQSRYLLRVHRLRTGDRCIAFDPERALEAELEVVATGRKKPTVVRLTDVRPATAVARRPIAVVQGLAKGAKIDAVVRDATELGATHIVLAICERSVKRDADLTRCRRIAIEAARQCGRGDLPEITGPTPLLEALETFSEERWLRVMLSPEAKRPLGALLGSEERPIVLVVGPEGGFSATEASSARDRGFAAAKLGPFVLRTETACAAALGAIVSAAHEP